MGSVSPESRRRRGFTVGNRFEKVEGSRGSALTKFRGLRWSLDSARAKRSQL
ncbi:hypothetical protein KFK09_024187 [Dendrobium nobile]|uniref:Uncharacterized protein n=1 Tax=Dendrobium nobile TaxID=94219 RepID=A0A8T3ABZ2_DENNO|nr:hypothetical protein KFK09_024187 [Dendrobium nobile]